MVRKHKIPKPSNSIRTESSRECTLLDFDFQQNPRSDWSTWFSLTWINAVCSSLKIRLFLDGSSEKITSVVVAKRRFRSCQNNPIWNFCKPVHSSSYILIFIFCSLQKLQLLLAFVSPPAITGYQQGTSILNSRFEGQGGYDAKAQTMNINPEEWMHGNWHRRTESKSKNELL